MDQDKDNLEFKLSQLLDGDLDPTEEALLLARLREDSDLARQLAGYKHLDEMLEDLAVAPELSRVDYDAQRSEIMAKLEKKALLTAPRRLSIVRIAFSGALAAAATLLIVFGASMFFRNNAPTMLPSRLPVAVSEMPRAVNQGSVQSEVLPVTLEGGDEVAMVQVRVIYPKDDEFMLASPDENPITNEMAKAPASSQLPPNTVLMIQDNPATDKAGFDMFDIH